MFLLESDDVEKLVKILTNYSVAELRCMMDEYYKQVGRKPEKLLIPRVKLFGVEFEFYDDTKPAFYSKIKEGDLDA